MASWGIYLDNSLGAGNPLDLAVVGASLPLASLLSGCASNPIASSSASPVPADRLVAYFKPVSGANMLTVTRDTGFVGGACSSQVFIDGKLAAYVRAGETVTLYVPQDEFIIGAQSSNPCPGPLVEIEAKAKKVVVLRYRLSHPQNGDPGLVRTAVQ